MPAPTALKQAEDTPLATNVPLPQAGKILPRPSLYETDADLLQRTTMSFY